MADVEPELEAAARGLWAEYRAARDAKAAYDYEGLARRVRSLRAKARREGFTVVAQQLGDLGQYVAQAKELRLPPEDRVQAFWPALIPAVLVAALAAAEEALAVGSRARLRRAASMLRCLEAPERLADVAEEGLAEEFAAIIPGAEADAGMLVLSTEHAGLIERGLQALARVKAALRAKR